MGAPFEYGARLADLSRRQQEIEDELDLTKNQASAQLGSEAQARAEIDSNSERSPEDAAPDGLSPTTGV